MGGLTYSKSVLSQNTEFFIKFRVFFSDFSTKKVGGLAQYKISLAEKICASKLTGGGGSHSFGETPKKTSLFLMPPLISCS